MNSQYPNNSNRELRAGTSRITALIEQYQSWSRPMRFFLWVAIVLIAYIGVISPAFSAAARFRASANADEQKMIQISHSAARHRSIIEKGRKQWGNLTLPEKGTGASGADLQKVITSVLNDHGIRSGITIKDIGTEEIQGASSTQRSARNRNRNRAARDSLTLLQTKTQVQFTATPDVLSIVLAELEKNQKVAAIQRVSITADARRPVLTVTLVVQSWNR